MKQKPQWSDTANASLSLPTLPLELVGEIASAYNLPIELLLLLQSSMIAGIGGSDPLRISSATCPVILTAEAQAEARLVDRLSTDLRFSHRGLLNKRRYLKTRHPLDEFKTKSSPMMLSDVARAAKPGASPYDDSLLHVEDADSMDIPMEELRLEAILRPGFLVESLSPADLGRALSRCHRCEGFYPGSAPVILSLEGRKRQTWADELCDLLDGKVLPGVENLDPDGSNETVTARLQMIMRLNQEGRRWVVRQHPGLLARCLILPTAVPPMAAGEARLNARNMEAYFNRFHDACRRALGRRRAGLPPFDGKAGGELEPEFLQLYRGYSQFIGSDDILAACAPLARLPEFLAVGIQALAGKTAVEGIEEIAFDAARRIAEAHRGEVLSHLHSERLEDFRGLASKVIAVVSKKQPVSLRTLVRSFDHQRVEIYKPVISMLLECQVLEGDFQGLRLGSRHLGELNLDTLAVARLAEGS